MANIFLTETAQFKPFSYAEMLAPVKDYMEAYNKYDEDFANLDLMTADIASKLNHPKDSKYVQQVLDFQRELQSAMEDFYKEGITSNTRKTLRGLQSLYTNKLNKINEAYKAYQEDQKYLTRLAVDHPELLIEGAGQSVSDYMGGVAPQMRSVNTDDLMNQAMAIAKTQAGRTYRESNWTSTAGGRFLEKTVEIGLNDTDFNNALAFVKNPNLTAADLGVSDVEFNKIKSNASLLNASMSDIINTPSFQSLSDNNKKKALNSIIKGVRAGFQYDKKTDTESDPMFAYNIKKREEEEKARAKREEQADRVGSDYFLTPNETKEAHRNAFTITLGKDAGKLDKFYEKYFKEGKLITREEAEKEASKLRDNSPKWNTTSGPWAPAPIPSLGYGSSSYMTDYNELVGAFNDLNLDINTATKEDFLKALNTDVQGRKRASITSNDSGFKVIQSNIERGLKDQKTVDKIVGLNASSLGNMGSYRTEAVEYDKLLDKDGNLNILGINMDYATGQLSASLKTKDGYMEIVLPEGSTYKATDSTDLAEYARDLSLVQQGMYPVYTKDYNGNPILNYIPLDNGYLPGTKILGTDYVSKAEREMNVIFGDLFNFFGAEDVND